MRYYNLNWAGWTLLLILNTSTLTSSFDDNFQGVKSKEPKKWDFQCSKYLKIQYYSDDKVQFSEDFADKVKFKKETNLHEKSISINLQDSKLFLRQIMEETNRAGKCPEGVESCASTFKSKFYFKFSDGNGVIQRNLTIRSSTLPSPDLFDESLAVEISDDVSGSLFQIFKMAPIPQATVFSNVSKGAINLDFPVLNSIANLSSTLKIIDPDTVPEKMWMQFRLQVQWNNESAVFQILESNYKAEDENENVSKTPTVAKLESEKKFNFKGGKRGSMVGNITSINVDPYKIEKWIFIESDGWRWPLLDFSWKHLEMRNNPKFDGWVAAIAQFSFGQLILKATSHYYSVWKNIEIEFRFNSGSPISLVVLNLDLHNLVCDLTLGSLEEEWKLRVLKVTDSTGVLSASLTRASFFTEHKKPITVFNVTSEINDIFTQVTWKISEFENLVDCIEAFIAIIIDPLQTLMNENILLNIFDHLTEMVGGSMNEDFPKEVNLLESLLKNVGRIIYTNVIDFAVKEKQNIKDIFIKYLNKTGGSYIEEDGSVIVKHPLDSFSTMALPIALCAL